MARIPEDRGRIADDIDMERVFSDADYRREVILRLRRDRLRVETTEPAPAGAFAATRDDD